MYVGVSLEWLLAAPLGNRLTGFHGQSYGTPVTSPGALTELFGAWSLSLPNDSLAALPLIPAAPHIPQLAACNTIQVLPEDIEHVFAYVLNFANTKLAELTDTDAPYFITRLTQKGTVAQPYFCIELNNWAAWSPLAVINVLNIGSNMPRLTVNVTILQALDYLRRKCAKSWFEFLACERRDGTQIKFWPPSLGQFAFQAKRVTDQTLWSTVSFPSLVTIKWSTSKSTLETQNLQLFLPNSIIGVLQTHPDVFNTQSQPSSRPTFVFPVTLKQKTDGTFVFEVKLLNSVSRYVLQNNFENQEAQVSEICARASVLWLVLCVWLFVCRIDLNPNNEQIGSLSRAYMALQSSAKQAEQSLNMPAFAGDADTITAMQRIKVAKMLLQQAARLPATPNAKPGGRMAHVKVPSRALAEL